MSSDAEILQHKVGIQEKQLRVLRAALAGREELLASIPSDASQSVPDPKWLLLFRRQLKDQARLEMAAANAGKQQHHHQAGSAAAEDPLAVDPLRPFCIDPPTVTVADVAPRSLAGDAPSCANAEECVTTLLGTTRQLVEVWQDALRERYRSVLQQIAGAFASFRARPSDSAVQRLLAALHDTMPEVQALLGDAAGGQGGADDSGDFSGSGGNPFSSDYASLAAFFQQTFVQHTGAAVAKAVAEAREARDGGLHDTLASLKREAGQRAEALREAEGRLAACVAQRDTLHNDVALWKSKFDALQEQARSIPPVRPVHREVAESVQSTPRLPSERRFSRGMRSQASTPSLSPLPSAASHAPGSARVEQLRAALGHLEAQLAAACCNNNGLSQRHGHIRRRMDAVRAALAQEESEYRITV